MIKKQYQELVDFLEANKNEKVSTILEEILSMVSSKRANNLAHMKDADGNVIAIYCYYHKRWEDPREVKYGKKVSNKATGLNTMCKLGVSAWTKTQRALKQLDAEVLQKVSKQEISLDEIKQYREYKIEEIKESIANAHQHAEYLYLDISKLEN